jgi:subtilisin family serine protease
MVDSGFYTGHPYFVERGYRLSVILAPGATERARDGNGHGTAESANLLAVAPDVDFVGIKLDNEEDPAAGASLAEGFKTAVAQDPDVISVSLGFDLADPQTRRPRTSLPNSLKPLEAEIEAAVAAGIVVVFSAGNGHVAFPGMMPDVLSAGGTYVDEKLERIASDYASAFESRIYAGRRVPDVTGLVGLLETEGSYILLPLQPGSAIDREVASAVDPWGDPRFADGTAADDGWCVISGTSAAAPQLAGVCALLRQKNPSLTPAEIKSLLQRTARDVLTGHANPASNEGVPIPAGPGPDGATGHGLVDAFAAWKQA